MRSVETSCPERLDRVDSIVPIESPSETTAFSLPDVDSEQVFNRSWGYLPPLDQEAVGEIKAIMTDLEIPEKAKSNQRIGAEKGQFIYGLKDRNVEITESNQADPYACYVKDLTLGDSVMETDRDRESHEDLWSLDRAQCKGDSNEAMFQRTLMMSSIARHCLIYSRDPNHERYLDFSVEAPWGCPPMPTRAYKKREKFLTQPKPDLAVCFRSHSILSQSLWDVMPKATLQLACYENMNNETGITKVFHFFTIEGKKASTPSDDSIGKRQILNNASQALHNMFEFFRDAGETYERLFYEKVRFFTVVASHQGFTIRIHRAVRDPGDLSGSTFIMKGRDDYPLRFTYEEYLSLPKDVERQTVLETFQKILIGYGEVELRDLLSKAAKALLAKLHNDPSELQLQQRQHIHFYRYGQINILPQSRKQTPAASLAPSVTSRSFEGLRVDSQTSTPGRSETPRKDPAPNRKRVRKEQSHSNQGTRNTRQRGL